MTRATEDSNFERTNRKNGMGHVDGHKRRINNNRCFEKKKKKKKRTVHSIIVIDPNEQTLIAQYRARSALCDERIGTFLLLVRISLFTSKCRQSMAVGKMSRGIKFCRLVLTLLNVSFIILGLILLVLGFLIVHNPIMQQLRPLLNPDVTWKYAQFFSNIEIFSIVLIIIGGLLFTLGFIGR